MVVNERLQIGSRADWGTIMLRLEFQVFFSLRGFLQEVFGDIAIFIDPAGFQLQECGFECFQPIAEVIVSRGAPLLENGAGTGRKLFIQPFLHALPAQVHDAIHAKVEVGLFKLEEFPEKRLKFFEWRCHDLV